MGSTIIKMNKCIILIILFFGFGLSGKSTTIITNEMANLRGLAISIDQYKRDNDGNTPSNWPSLIRSKSVTPLIIKNLRDHGDFEKNYQFLSLQDYFEFGIDRNKIILLENQPRGDGNPSILKRYLITENSEGKINTRRSTEEELQILFQKNGYDLADYTISPHEMADSNPKKIQFTEIKKTELLNSRKSKDISKKQKSFIKNQDNQRSDLIWIVSSLILVVSFTLYIFKRFLKV